jgi:renalase
MSVDLIDSGRAPGGRMASPELHGRRVDIGAAYFTATDADFVAIVAGWTARGLVREWTDTFDVYSADGHHRAAGPTRYATPQGLRSLVRAALPDGVRSGETIVALEELDHDAVVLAMPDPQAARLATDVVDWVAYEPVIAVAAGWAKRCWPIADAAFVNDDPDLAFVADDGSRRGDGAAVLVAHTTAPRARVHLENPDTAVAPVLEALRRVLAVTAAPEWTHAQRWTFAKPANTHGDNAFGLVAHSGRPLGLCGDSWCPSGTPRIESAWLSGHRLGAALADKLGS